MVSISFTFFKTTAADSQFLATFCNKAVVEFVLNNPKALRFNPCDRHASTAANDKMMINK